MRRYAELIEAQPKMGRADTFPKLARVVKQGHRATGGRRHRVVQGDRQARAEPPADARAQVRFAQL